MIPQIFAILNICPDSFSDGGLYATPQKAIERSKYLISTNIYAIDIGAVSTRPNASIISDSDEINRLKPILPKVINIAKNAAVKISLDSFNYKTICYGIDAGIDIINDVNALRDERFIDLLAQNKQLQIVFMHSLSLPADKNIIMQQSNEQMLGEIANYASIKIAKMLDKGLELSNIIFDPGLGFGKNANQGLYIMKNLFVLKQMILANLGLNTKNDIQVLIGHSRKSMLRELSGYNLTQNQEIDNAALTALTNITTKLILENNSCNFIRVH